MLAVKIFRYCDVLVDWMVEPMVKASALDSGPITGFVSVEGLVSWAGLVWFWFGAEWERDGSWMRDGKGEDGFTVLGVRL